MTVTDIPEQHGALPNHRQTILALADTLGVLRSRDFVARGLPRITLTRLVREGLLVRVSPGVYARPAGVSANHAPLALVALKKPQGVVCLLSALHLHQLLSSAPAAVWLGIPNKARAPNWASPPLRLVRFSGLGLSTGVETHQIGGVSVRVTNLARTVADCFKFRKEIGLEVAVAALQAAWSSGRVTREELSGHAKHARVAGVMHPYLMTLGTRDKIPGTPGLSMASMKLPRAGAGGEQESFNLSTKPVRPVHYLGSKLRIASTILETIEEVATGDGPVCDLFSGSGTVSHALSLHWPVVSVDIQEYARVLSSALIRPLPTRPASLDDLALGARAPARQLRAALAPIIAYEARCLELAGANQCAPLCDLVELGSLFVHEVEGPSGKPETLSEALSATLRRLKERGLYHGVSSTVTRYFGGTYFSYAQAADLDALLDAAHACPAEVRDVALAAVLSTASELVNTVGKQFAQPIKLRDRAGAPKPQLMEQTLRDRNTDAWSCFRKWLFRYRSNVRPKHAGNLAVRADYRQFLESHTGHFSCIYADPPYTREHYSRFYHVLETLCLRDTPDVATADKDGEGAILRGMYRVDRHQSPFCLTSQALEAFTMLFQGAKRFNVPLVLSYSPFNEAAGEQPRVLTIDELVALAREHYSRVSVREAGRITHGNLSAGIRRRQTDRLSEVLLVCHSQMMAP